MIGNKKRGLVAALAVAFLLFGLFWGLRTEAFALGVQEEGRICEGIFVSGIDLGGKSVDEAKSLIQAQIDEIMKKKVMIRVTSEGEEQGTEEVTFSEIGFRSEGEDIVSEVATIGTRGNLIERYKERKDAEEKTHKHNLSFSYDEKKLSAFAKKVSEKYAKEAEDARLIKKEEAFIVEGGRTGTSFEEEELLGDIKKMVDDFVTGLPKSLPTETRLEAKLKVTKPKYDKENLAKVKDLLGTYTTSFAGGAAGRMLNIINGAKHIDGTLLLPGEVMSANKKMYPYTIANGYHLGGAFLNGKVVSDIGGGICQVSTTLYNAALYAEIGIEERQNHSMTVTYVPLARDAAIAGDYKDLVIKNTTENPIYIEAITGNGKITFNLYGHETRDTVNRKVDFETVTLKTIQPGKPVITEDPEKPEDFEETVQNAWIGYRTELYKVVKVNGVQTERSLVNQSNYRASPAYKVKGTKAIEDSEEIDSEDGLEEKKPKKGKKKVKKGEVKPEKKKPKRAEVGDSPESENDNSEEATSEEE